jgi:hypothetical protein
MAPRYLGVVIGPALHAFLIRSEQRRGHGCQIRKSLCECRGPEWVLLAGADPGLREVHSISLRFHPHNYSQSRRQKRQSQFSKDGQMNKLNGWWRVWVVGVVLLGLGFGWVGKEKFPTYPYDALDYHNSRTGPLLIEKMAVAEGRTPTRPAAEIQQDIDAIHASMSSIVKNYNQRKLEHRLEYFGGWIASCIAMLLGLWAFRWVIAGFGVKKL